MIKIRVSFKGDPLALRRHHRVLSREVLPRAVKELARTTRRVILKHVPVDSGRLRNSIDVVRLDDHHRLVFADTPYATTVEFGFQGVQVVRTHQRLQTHAFGRPITARQVNVVSHTRFVNRSPKPYMRPGLRHASERAVPILIRHLRQAA